MPEVRGCRAAAGGWEGSSGGLLEASWRVQKPAPGSALEAPGAVLEALGDPWRHLGRPGGRPGGVLGAPGATLEASKRRLGGSLRRLEAVSGDLEVCSLLELSGGQKAPKMETKRAPSRAPEATRAENGETLTFDDSAKDFLDFSRLRPVLRKNRFKMCSEMHP